LTSGKKLRDYEVEGWRERSRSKRISKDAGKGGETLLIWKRKRTVKEGGKWKDTARLSKEIL